MWTFLSHVENCCLVYVVLNPRRSTSSTRVGKAFSAVFTLVTLPWPP